MTREEYKENLIRMWDSLRTDNKGAENCGGVRCLDCPLYGKACGPLYAFEALEIIENWAKEHPVKTNADKFKETFGFQAPMNRCVQSNVFCAECEYYDDERSDCRADERFWNTEYKEPAESEVEG